MKKIMFSDKFGLTEAVLSGRKTMTRRICPDGTPLGNWAETVKKSRYQVGEVVAVAQRYRDFILNPISIPADMGWFNKLFVRADLMPHQIRITNVRVERLQDISDEDCIKEGIWMAENVGFQGVSYWYPNLCNSKFKTPREAYAALIDRISTAFSFKIK